MKILIIGLGNIGAIHGWALSQAGADITHAVRRGTKDRFENGVKMDILDLRGDSANSYQAVYKPNLTDEVSPDDKYELVMVATNHLQAIGAVRQYCNLAPEASFLMFTANWDGTDEYDKLLSRPRYLWGFSISTGARGEDGVLYANVQKSYRIGELDGSRTPRLERIVALFARAGMNPDIKSNIIEWQWVHHAIDAGMLGATLYKGGLPSPDEGIDTWLLMVRSTRDALAVLEKRGVNVRAYDDTRPFLGPGDEEAAANLRRTWTAAPHYQRMREHSHFQTSPEEMRQFYLDVLTTGERLGVPMPYLESFNAKICSGD
ncbi:MAG TPA: 2-dehydropantoate 2-reductase N-terminal domain-containing protein [Dehalococcoidia bacterium]